MTRNHDARLGNSQIQSIRAVDGEEVGGADTQYPKQGKKEAGNLLTKADSHMCSLLLSR